MADQADAAIDAIRANYPAHRPGTRPIHAPGIGATGWFQASTIAASHSSAEHLSGRRIPVTVRFSNGTGLSDDPDGRRRTVRGMSVRFHLGDVEVDEHGVARSPRETDLVSMTLPMFFVNTLDDFLRLCRAAVPKPEPPLTPWRSLTALASRLVGVLRLLPVDPTMTVADRELVAFADEHHPARLAMAATVLLGVPESYATCCYHAVHAFRLTSGDRATAVRFRWEPVAGVRPAADDVGDTFLRDELAERLRHGPAEFVLRAQVAEAGDDTSDPTTPWPEARRRLIMGQLSIDALAADQDHGCERLDFDPARLVPGVEVSDDEILQARHAVYARSFARRREERQEPTSS